MCGIAGFTGKKNIKLLRAQLQTMQHRGRDDEAIFYFQGIHLGMRRLAIIDLTKGLYPMVFKNYTLMYNGEIYNYKKLKMVVEKQGYTPKTNSDAEVILPLYAKYGKKAFSMLEGMFAICIYDKTSQSILLIRDKMGEKPLYYYHNDNSFIFASEVKALLKHPEIKRNVNDSGIHSYLQMGYNKLTSLVRGIEKVEPSQVVHLSLSKNTLKTTKYWHIPTQPKPHNPATQLVKTLDSLISKSVKLRLVSDVPVGCFLSGGIDSSIITYYAASQKPNIHTYSVAFPGFEKEDESHYAQSVSKWLKTKHTEVHCRPVDIKEIVHDIGRFIDEPISDPAFLPTVIMARKARNDVKVVLTGEGADELFAGYDRYPKHLMIESVRKIPFFPMISSTISRLSNNKKLGNASKPLPMRYHTQRIWTQEELFQLIPSASRSISFRKNNLVLPTDTLLSMQIDDLRGYLAEQLLMKVDKATMIANLEARAPFLDTELMQFALSLPSSYKTRYFQTKIALRMLARQHFPDWFSNRPKHGFSVPLRDWFCKELKETLHESKNLAKQVAPSINVNYYNSIIDSHLTRSADHSDKIWSMIVLLKWLEHHKLSL